MQCDVVILSGIKKIGATIMCVLVFLCNVQAAELGEAVVSSFIGQPLIADVELTALAPEDNTALQVKMAPIDVYRGANIRFNPALSSVRLTVKRQGQRQFVHIVSTQAIDSSTLILYLELTSGNEYMVRALTLWLDVDPNAANVPTTAQQEKLTPAHPADLPTDDITHEEQPTPVAVVPFETVHQAEQTRPVRHAAKPKIVCQQPSTEAIQSCIVAERENKIIAAHIQELEKNVIVLRSTISGHPESESNASALSPAHDVIPKKENAPATKKVVAQTIPWKIIGIVGLALAMTALGAYVGVILRRRKSKPARRSPTKQPVKPAADAAADQSAAPPEAQADTPVKLPPKAAPKLLATWIAATRALPARIVRAIKKRLPAKKSGKKADPKLSPEAMPEPKT